MGSWVFTELPDWKIKLRIISIIKQNDCELQSHEHKLSGN